ncbi:MAG: hypothetical protein KDI42_04020, partial [Gammaproteobacteria bacterium]|nr:hypothetical protein [Gammaproteobacteria bacterium]
RGGWSWYTGSAGWMYRLILESLLGLRLETDRLHIAPCLPAHWDRLKIHYRFRETVYHLAIVQTPMEEGEHSGVVSVTVDGVAQEGAHDGTVIALVDDRQEHAVVVTMRAERS